MDEGIELGELLTAICANLQGIRSELRAMRLEQRAMLGSRIDEQDAADLATALNDADEIAEMLEPEPEPEPDAARMMS